MSVTRELLAEVDRHWAVQAIGERKRKRALEAAQATRVQEAVQLCLDLDYSFRADDLTNIERVALAYELAATEGLDVLLGAAASPEAEELAGRAQAGAYRAYELRTVLSVPEAPAEKVAHVLHLSALAYCGDRWSDLRRWLHEHPETASMPDLEGEPWDRRLLYSLFDGWLRLFRKDGWEDMDGVRQVVGRLREEQEQYEPPYLEQREDTAPTAAALRLVAFYHWAKATELLATFMLQGEPKAIDTQLDQHFEAALVAASASQDPELEVLLRWLHVAARQMAAGSIWWIARSVNSRVTRFVERATEMGSLFELLPPQRAALREQGLLDQAAQAIVVNLPTSGGKTILAEFRILQALNQFDEHKGWVAYVAPTRALVNQLTRRLRRDFEPIGIQVEPLTAAVEIDHFETELLTDSEVSFHVLVATPEKLDLVIRNRKIPRPLALLVMDEAHNLEDVSRGLRIELLLATVKRDCPQANFLLLVPDVPNDRELAQWLAPGQSRTISLGTSAWKPNERVVGTYWAMPEEGRRGDWRLRFRTLVSTPGTIHLKGEHSVDGVRPLSLPLSKVKENRTQLTGAMAKVFSERGTSIAIARTIRDVWGMARAVAADLPRFRPIPEAVSLVQRFLQTEVSRDFELVELLAHGVGVHHAGLSDEARGLMEWLAEDGHLRVLCATTTITQGINFPVSSVFLASIYVPTREGRMMTRRAFWNMAGRAGRMNQDSVGVVGLAVTPASLEEVVRFVRDETEELVSRLDVLLEELQKAGRLMNLERIIYNDDWASFRGYVAHLWNEKRELDGVLGDIEQLLRNTFGYSSLRGSAEPARRQRARALLDATRTYAIALEPKRGQVALADSTGFSPEGVGKALVALSRLERKLEPRDWRPESLFGPGDSVLPDLVGIMMRIPEIKTELLALSEDEVGLGGEPTPGAKQRVAVIASDWVGGASIEDIAVRHFQGRREDAASMTEAINKTCRSIYRTLSMAGSWGLGALSKVAYGDLRDRLTEEEIRTLDAVPAMLYHGVSTEKAVLMRMNGVPRSVAEGLGERFQAQAGRKAGVRDARAFLRGLELGDWTSVVPPGAPMDGEDFRRIWEKLSGGA